MTTPASSIRLFLVLSLFLAQAQAGDLYEVRVPVADESSQTRSLALRSAMQVVLVRLAGSRQALTEAQLQEFLREVNRYVLRYRYQTGELSVSFAQAALDQRLREHNIAIWGRQRPAVLLWLLVSDATGVLMLSREEPGHAAHLRALGEQAQLRGITLIYPLLDIAESERVRPSDVRGGFVRPIIEASRRYGADVVLHGVLDAAQTEQWRLRWQALYTDTEAQAEKWSGTGGEAASLLRQGIDRLSDSLAAHYLPGGAASTQQQALALTVHEVVDLAQYAALHRYLENLNSVISVHPERFQGDTVLFTLESTGDEGVLRRAISLGRSLQAVAGSQGLEYTWRAPLRAR